MAPRKAALCCTPKVAKSLGRLKQVSSKVVHSFNCVLCRKTDFCNGKGLGPRTVIICDSCEKEYHVGCLREHGGEDLQVRMCFSVVGQMRCVMRFVFGLAATGKHACASKITLNWIVTKGGPSPGQRTNPERNGCTCERVSLILDHRKLYRNYQHCFVWELTCSCDNGLS